MSKHVEAITRAEIDALIDESLAMLAELHVALDEIDTLLTETEQQ